MMTTSQRSAIFSAYNEARAAARKGIGGLEPGRVNRALGILQSKSTRPYITSLTDCNCIDRQRHPGIACKHLTARWIEYRAIHPKGTTK